MDFTTIQGGVCAPKGFKANGMHCGIRANRTKADLALIVSDEPCSAVAIYTTNLVKGAPLTVTKQHIADGKAQAIVCNSGNANTCNANGIEIAESMAALVEQATGIAANDVIVASTGVIGEPLSLEPIAKGLPVLLEGLSADGSNAATQAIMTTDTFAKEYAVTFQLNGKQIKIGGMAKGSGMICPNMATMLCFITSDAAIDAKVLQVCLHEAVADTFNILSIDGDTSTNDMLCIMANGLAGNAPVESIDSEDAAIFTEALKEVCAQLCRMLAMDGEGASHLLVAAVQGAKDKENARKIAKSVVNSNLLKCAIFGADANWGRVLCAIGYSGADTNVDKIGVKFVSAAGEVVVCANGVGMPFNEEEAKAVLSKKEITITITCGDGDAQATAYGCDMTYDYVKINGDYRT